MAMKLAVMQPYFFPYIGYWQLIHAVNRFVIYDDVTYIKGGWINRNRILINAEPAFITVPLRDASPNKRICDTALQVSSWRDRLIRMVEVTYRRAPGFPVVFPIVERLIRYETGSLATFLAHQLRTLAGFMGLHTEFVSSSRCYQNSDLTGQTRVLDICCREGASVYVNPAGGKGLYQPTSFRERGVDLRFVGMHSCAYRQRSKGFVADLSIIDALMEVGPSGIKRYIEAYDLVEGT
jgi:hypothetical protein